MNIVLIVKVLCAVVGNPELGLSILQAPRCCFGFGFERSTELVAGRLVPSLGVESRLIMYRMVHGMYTTCSRP